MELIKYTMDGVKSKLTQTDKEVEELKFQTSRFKKYDDFFVSCNANILHNLSDIKAIDKRLTEEIN